MAGTDGVEGEEAWEGPDGGESGVEWAWTSVDGAGSGGGDWDSLEMEEVGR